MVQHEQASVLADSSASPVGRLSAPSVPAQARAADPGLPPDCRRLGDLLHRGRALAVLEECARRLTAGRPVVAIIDGDRGSGKSALLAAVATGCGAGLVLRARCHGAERGFSFGVVDQLLDRLPDGDPGGTPPAGRGDDERHLFDRSYRMIRAVAEQGPVVLAIDDVHMADPLSARWCSYLARRLDDMPAGVLVTVNSGGFQAAGGAPAAVDLLADLGALAYSRVVCTGPLCEDCAGTLIARRLGRPADPAFTCQCHALTRGNPQILGMVAAQLAGAADAEPGAALEITAQVLAGAALRWLRQDDPVKARVAEQFAVCGGPLETAAMLAGQGEDVARTARVTLRRIGLLDARTPDRLAHPAMGEVIASLVPPQDRAAMHAHAATMFSQIGESAIVAAEHAMLAGTIGEPWTRQLLRQAAWQSAAAGDWERSARYLSRALLEPGPTGQTLAITAELGAVEFHHDVGACLRRAAAAADLAADDPESAAALAVFTDAALAVEDGDAAAASGRAAAALAAGSLTERGALLRLAASALLCGPAPVPEHAAAISQAMRGLARGPADMASRQLLAVLALGAAARGRSRGRSKILALRAAAAGPVRFTDPVPSTAACAALALAWAGELETASDACALAVEAAHRMASPTGEGVALFVRSEIAFQRGNLTAALNDAHQAFQLFTAVGAISLQAAAAAALTRVRLLRGDPGAVPAQASGPALRAAGHPFILAMQQEARGMIASAQANRALALRLYLESGRHLMAAGLVNPACSAWRSRAVTILAGLGRGWEARTLADTEVALARSWGAPGPLGRALAAAAGAHDGPPRRELLSEAVAVLEGSDCRLHLAQALIRLGTDMHAEAAEAAEAAEPSHDARDVLERGLDLAMECGAATLAATAHQVMHGTGTRRRGQHAATALTAAERRVAELVVAGMSNQAVAVRLTVSKRTVDTHLGRIYRKLGISGRAGLGEVIAGQGGHAEEGG